MEVVLKARDDTILELVKDYVAGKLSFDGLCRELNKRSFSTKSAYEMVRSYELLRACEEEH